MALAGRRLLGYTAARLSALQPYAWASPLAFSHNAPGHGKRRRPSGARLAARESPLEALLSRTEATLSCRCSHTGHSAGGADPIANAIWSSSTAAGKGSRNRSRRAANVATVGTLMKPWSSQRKPVLITFDKTPRRAKLYLPAAAPARRHKRHKRTTNAQCETWATWRPT